MSVLLHTTMNDILGQSTAIFFYKPVLIIPVENKLIIYTRIKFCIYTRRAFRLQSFAKYN